MFSADLVDDSGEIKCTFFNETVDQYEHVFEIGKVFTISRSTIKPGNPKFCRFVFVIYFFSTLCFIALTYI